MCDMTCNPAVNALQENSELMWIQCYEVLGNLRVLVGKISLLL